MQPNGLRYRRAGLAKHLNDYCTFVGKRHYESRACIGPSGARGVSHLADHDVLMVIDQTGYPQLQVTVQMAQYQTQTLENTEQFDG